MKKKVIAVLLASMMATSMVPVTAMAEDQPDVVSAEETQDQGFFEEETDVQEAETEAPAEEESQEEDSWDAVELEESEDADSLDLSQNTLESDSDEADPFGLTDGTAPAAEAAGTVTLNGVAFDTSKTYIVPLTLKNAHNLEQDSAAVA